VVVVAVVEHKIHLLDNQGLVDLVEVEQDLFLEHLMQPLEQLIQVGVEVVLDILTLLTTPVVEGVEDLV
jgi:hypothetical protein